MSVTLNILDLYYHCIMILGSREEQNFENFLKENYVRIGDGKCQCTICHKVTTHAGNMRQHFISHHSVGERVRCIACGKTFKNENSLNAHISCMHNKRTV